jgi:hypothetical protein
MVRTTATLYAIVEVRCDDCPRILARITFREDQREAAHGTMIQVLRDHQRLHEYGAYQATTRLEFEGTYAELQCHRIVRGDGDQ